MKKILSLILGLTLLASSSLAQAHTSPSKIKLSQFKHPTEKFQMKIPKDWEDLNTEDSGILMFIREDRGGEGGPNINILKVEAESENNFEEDVEELREGFAGTEDLSKKTDKPFTVKGGKGHLFGYIITSEGSESQNYQLYVKKNEKSYFITATANKKEWNKYKNLFTKILKSFRF